MPAKAHAYRRRKTSNPLGYVIGLTILAVVVVVSLMIASRTRRPEPAEPAPPVETARVDRDRDVSAQLDEIRNGYDPPRDKIRRIEMLIQIASTDAFKTRARMAIDVLNADIARAVEKDVEAVRKEVARLIETRSFVAAESRIAGLESKHAVKRQDIPELAKLAATIDRAWDSWADEIFKKVQALIAQGENLKAQGLLSDIDAFGKPAHKGQASYLRGKMRQKPEDVSIDPTIPPAIAKLEPKEEPTKPLVAPREEPEPPAPKPEKEAPPAKEPAPAEAGGGEPLEAFLVVGDRDRESGLYRASMKTGLRRGGSGLLEIPSGVPVYVDEEIQEKSLREALQANQKVHILGRLREDTGPTKAGWGGETRRIFNIVLLAMGESVEPNRRYRYAKDPGVNWFDGTVQDVGRGMPIRVTVDGRTYDFSGMPAHTIRRTQVGPSAIQPRAALYIRGEWKASGSEGRIVPKRIVVIAPGVGNYEPYLSFVQDGGIPAAPAPPAKK